MAREHALLAADLVDGGQVVVGADDGVGVGVGVVERVVEEVDAVGVGVGGGGPPPDPIPSDADFDWNVTRDIEIGEFSSGRRAYTGMADSSATVTTVEAIATQESATVAIAPTDVDGDPSSGHQITLEAETTITVTVRSADGSRTKSYVVQVSKPPCLGGLTEDRLSEVTFIGGSVSELEACVRSQNIAALHYWTDSAWLLLAPDAPEFLSRPFRQHFANGVAADSAFVAAAGSAGQVRIEDGLAGRR